jgi:hypothetical protein
LKSEEAQALLLEEKSKCDLKTVEGIEMEIRLRFLFVKLEFDVNEDEEAYERELKEFENLFNHPLAQGETFELLKLKEFVIRIKLAFKMKYDLICTDQIIPALKYL